MPRPSATRTVERHSPLIRFAAGVLSAFHGRHFTYLLLFAQVWEGDGSAFYSQVRHAIEELVRRTRENAPHINEATAASRDAMRRLNALQEAYGRASGEGGNMHEAELLQREMHDLQDELQQDVLRMGAAGSSIVSSLDPRRLALTARGLYLGFVGLAAAATSNAAARLGVGFDIGERLARTLHRLIEPYVKRLLPLICMQSGALAELSLHPRFDRYVDLTLVALCSSVGVGCAYHIERLVFLAANALWGAELAISAASDALGALLPAAWRRLLSAERHAGRLRLVRSSGMLLLAAAGTYYQIVLCKARPMPTAMQAVLFAPLLTERWLTATTLAVRGPLASVAQAAYAHD